MRPVRLRLEGFTSFRKPQEIDFSDLDLFVITGPTGSGKTSILDAVALALYGLVPRTKKPELKELISLGASQAKVELEFEVGGRRYRVARRVPRKGAQSVTVERLDGETSVPEVEGSGVREANDRLVEIVGLDYEAFTKAVLLPQGEFAEFLKGDVSERRRILIRLLALDRFERAAKRAREKATELRHTVTSGEQLLEREYGEVTDDALKEADNKASKAEKRAKGVEKAFQGARQRLAKRLEMDARCNDIQALVSPVQEQRLDLEGLSESWTTLKVRDVETRDALAECLRKRKEAEKDRKQARQSWQKVAAETGDDGALAGLEAAAASMSECQELIDRTSAALAKDNEERERVAARQAQLTDQLEAAEVAETKATQALESATAELEIARAQVGTAQQSASLVAELEEKQGDLELLVRDRREAELKQQVVVGRVEEAETRLHAVETEHQAAALRLGLRPGDECPVCGEKVKKLPPTDPATEAGLAKDRAALEAARDAKTEAEKMVAGLKARSDAGKLAVEGIEERLRDLGEALPLPDAEKNEQERKEVEQQARDGLSRATDLAKDLRSQLATRQAEMAALDATLSAARDSLKEAQERSGRACSRLVEALGDPLPEALDEVIADRRSRLREAASAREAAEQAYEGSLKEYEGALETRGMLDGELADLDATLGRQRALLEERRGGLVRMKIDDVPALPSEDREDREAEITGLHVHASALCESAGRASTALEKKLEALDKSILKQASKVDIEGPDMDYAAAMSALEEAAKNGRRTADRLKDGVSTLEERLGRKKQMLEDLEGSRTSMNAYEKVASELRANQFIAFLLKESFHDLALRASNELNTLSGEQYSLAAAGESFTVIDHANADERRGVVTLSGGETFLASLALALALAQSITDIAGDSAGARLEAMFIDEGFGALDPTALDLAVEALERLREGERMVGVITHLSALGTRIPSGIAVERTDGVSVVSMR